MLGNLPRPEKRHWDPAWGILFEEPRVASSVIMTVTELTDWVDANWRNEAGIPRRLTFSDADQLSPFDDLPWEIHDIDDVEAREIVTNVYKTNRVR